MKSSFCLKSGHRITVTAIHAAGVVCLEKTSPGTDGLTVGIHIPVEFAAVLAQAIEIAGQAIESGPCKRVEPFAAYASAEATARDFASGLGIPA